MDLYGDLLPKSNSDIVAASGGDESNNYITSGGWANIERSSLDSTTAAEKSAKICEEYILIGCGYQAYGVCVQA